MIALTRAVPAGLPHCELTHLQRAPIDLPTARRQHEAYESVLGSLGCEIVRLPETPDLPDSAFVEDTAVVLDEAAVAARPGAASRRAEVASTVTALERFREVYRLTPPATLDGGDVLCMGKEIYVGVSTRTNLEGARQLAAVVAPYGYTVRMVPVRGCLHLKSAVTAIAPGALLCNPDWIDPTVFAGIEVIRVHPAEPLAANVLRLDGSLVCAAAHVRTAAILERRGCKVASVDLSELAKAEAGVTCCSLILGRSSA